MSRSRAARSATLLRTVLAAAVVLPLFVSVPADARAGGGFSFGSRGSRTFSMPSATPTAPRPAMPFGQTETPRYGAGPIGGFSQPRRFGFGSGLAAGLLGAGVLGMLTGHGFFGGIGSLFSLVGLVLQIGLIVLLVRFALGWLRGRSRGPAFAGRGSQPIPGSGPMPRSGLGGLGFPGMSSRTSQRPVTIGPDDYASFERLLSEVQYSYSREDLVSFNRLATPEMLRQFQGQIEENRRQNLRNDMADVRLLQGDLSESWAEGAADYATVAMRFSARDTMRDRQSGRVVSGDPSTPVEATELWTFVRQNRGAWVLAAIQQVS